MEATKKTFIGRLNTDDSEMLLPPGDYTSANNIRIITPEGSETGRVTNVLAPESLVGTLFPMPSGVKTTIGAYEDRIGRRLYWFFVNDDGLGTISSHIHMYDADTKTGYRVLRDSEVTGDLGFTADSLIHSVSVINDVLYWTDNLNPPRRLNIGAAIKMYTGGTSPVASDFTYSSPISQDDISLIRRPPGYCAWTEKKTDATHVNNFISIESFQFAFQYQYYDGEVSVLSPWSRTVRINRDNDTYNYIKTTLHVDEEIPVDALVVRLIVRVGLSGKCFVVRDWDRRNSDDLTLITAHDSGATPLTFDFYNDVIGEAIDDVTSVKPFDSVPLLANTLTVARSRLFLGNCTEGYDTPTTTSLAVTPVETNITGTFADTTYEVRVESTLAGTTTYRSSYMLFLPGVDQDGWYEIPTTPATSTVTYPAPAAAPITDAYADLIFRGHNLKQVAENVKAGAGVVGAVTATDSGLAFSATAVPMATTGSVYCGYHPKSAYQFGIVFYDKALRKSTVVTNSTLKVEVEDRDYNFTSIVSSFNCTLPTGATTEIPDWAYYYQIVRTDDLKTRFWLQSFVTGSEVFYVTKDSFGDYVFTATTYSGSVVGLAISTTAMDGSSIGYQYQQGDVCVLYQAAGSKYTLPVIDQSGKYIILGAKDIGTTTSNPFIYEVYSPYGNNIATEPYFEMGEMFEVTDPTLPTREFSNTSIYVRGDAVYMARSFDATTYEVVAMSPSDKYWQRRMNDNGRPNIVSKLGQQQKKTSVSYSNVYLQGSTTNGLSSFEALNETNLPDGLGEIQRLVLTSKAQSEGTVMLAIGKTESASLYLGESQLFDTEGSTFLARTNSVIGSVNILKGSYGTLHPESVVESNGQVWFWDTINASPVLYNSNGMFPVANYKMVGYYRQISRNYLDSYNGETELSTLGGRNIALGGVDPYNDEFLLYTPNFYGQIQADIADDMLIGSEQSQSNIAAGTEVSITPTITQGRLYKITFTYSGASRTISLYDTINGSTPNRTIVSATLTVPAGTSFYFRAGQDAGTILLTNSDVVSVALQEVLDVRYNLYDGQEATLSFNPTNDGFVSRLQIHPEYFGTINNMLVAFTQGTPKTYTDTTRTLTSQIAFVHNEGGTTPKVYGSVVVEGTKPDYIHVRTEKPNVQSSSILEADFDDREGVYYAEVKRDRLSPNTSGSYETKEYRGDKMIGNVAKFSVVYTTATDEENLNNVTILYTPSRGHKI